MAIETVEAASLQDVLAGSKARGAYDSGLLEFLESGAPGGKVDTTKGIFQGKKAQTLKSGFEAAKARLMKLAEKPEGTEKVVIKVNDGTVYLIREDLL